MGTIQTYIINLSEDVFSITTTSEINMLYVSVQFNRSHCQRYSNFTYEIVNTAHSCVGLYEQLTLVPVAGVEPARLAASLFESDAFCQFRHTGIV